jgi:hypothetical protein
MTFGEYDSLSKWKLSNIVLCIIRHDYGCQAGLIVVNGRGEQKFGFYCEEELSQLKHNLEHLIWWIFYVGNKNSD